MRLQREPLALLIGEQTGKQQRQQDQAREGWQRPSGVISSQPSTSVTNLGQHVKVFKGVDKLEALSQIVDTVRVSLAIPAVLYGSVRLSP